MSATAFVNNNAVSGVLYMAMELSLNKWCIAFGNGMKMRQVILESNDKLGLWYPSGELMYSRAVQLC